MAQGTFAVTVEVSLDGGGLPQRDRSIAQRTLRTAVACLLTASFATAQFPGTAAHKLIPGGVGDTAGSEVVLRGDILAVGSPRDGAVGSNAGSVSIYERDGSGWSLVQTLYASDVFGQVEFGEVLDFDGTTIAVSATPFSSGLPGNAWAITFDGNQWVVEDLPRPNILTNGSLFGQSVAVDGDTIVVGDRGYDTPGKNNVGAVFVYERIAGSWVMTQPLVATSFADSTLAGYDVDLDGDTMAVGTFDERVILYERTAGVWAQSDVLLSDDPSDDAYFGSELCLRGDLLAVGAEHDTILLPETGSVTVFRRLCGSFEREAILLPPLLIDDGDRFGDAVAIDGDVLVVGATFQTVTGASFGGAATVYRHDGFGWQYEQQLEKTVPQQTSYFGFAVDVEGDEIVVGARLDNEGGISSGAVFVFEGTPVYEPWATLGAGLAGFAGVPELVGAGTLTAVSAFQLSLGCGNAFAPVALVVGVSALNAPFKGGTLVPNPDLIVFGLSTDNRGELVIPATWPAGVPASTPVYLQAWITDAAGPVGFAASNGAVGTTP